MILCLIKENKMENNEVWKDIEGYEGHYQVSDYGRVKSVKFGKERILRSRRDGCGYLQVILCKNGEMKTFRIHRIVAQAFILNPNNLPELNHKDEDKTNNSVQNLEWCDRKYNNNFGTINQRRAEKLSKPVLQYTKSGEFVREWKSTHDVQRNLGYAGSSISRCCRGKLKSAYGFVWKYII